MPETTQVNIKLPVSMKREWEDYVEENEDATSLSHLIRKSVQRQINDEHGSIQSVELDDDVDLGIEVDGTEIDRRLSHIEDTLQEVADTVTALETGHLADEDQIEDIADRIYDTIPRMSAQRIEDGPELSLHELAKELLEDAQIELEDRGRTIEDLAEAQNWDYGLVDVYQEYFGINDYEIQKAIERVEQYSSRVHVVDRYEYTIIFETE